MRTVTHIQRLAAKVAAVILVLSVFVTPMRASACSVCIAHALGAAMHALGAQTLPNGTVIFGFNYATFTKSNEGEDPGTTEHETFNQYSFDVNYGLNDRVVLRLSVPWVDKDIRVTGEQSNNAHGLGDVLLGATFQLPPRANDSVVTAFTLDLKLPTGANNDKDSDGALREQHLQVGTGSTDVILGAEFSMEGSQGSMWIAGIRGRINGSNNRHYSFGNVLFYDLGYVKPVGHGGAVVLDFNGRIADKDRTEDGSKDTNSGGHLGYLSFSYRQGLKHDVGVIATYQVPVWKQLNGSQSESPLFSLGVSKTF